jgi:hypothetical protein
MGITAFRTSNEIRGYIEASPDKLKAIMYGRTKVWGFENVTTMRRLHKNP